MIASTRKRASLDAHLSLLGALSDATRLRLCAVLSLHELSVVELTSVLELGQSKVSTHLARLKEQGLVLDRRLGTSNFYRLNDDGMSEAARKLWAALSGTLGDVTVERDRARARSLIEARERSSWPERNAGELERHYSPGRTWESLAQAFAGLVRTDLALDLGAGDGTVADMLAPRIDRYVCLDVSARMLSAARTRLASRKNVALVRGDAESLPFAGGSFGLVLSLNVLAYAAEPARALAEASRVTRPGGDLLLVTLHAHQSMEVAAQYGHRHPGFGLRWLRSQLVSHGMRVHRCEVTSRERTRPSFEVVTCLAQKV